MNFKYITQARLPTERAHGTQVVKMCEAFASAGAEVSLIAPDKKNPSQGDDIFSYYNVRKSFSFVRLQGTDFLGKTFYFGRLFYWVDAFTFIFSLFFTRAIKAGDILYARDSLLLLLFSKKKHRLCVEVHDIPKRNTIFIWLLKRAHKVVVLNELIKEELVALGIASEKIIAQADAVDLAEFDINVSREEARKKISLPANAKIAVYTGHLYEWKGADNFAEAAKYLPKGMMCVFVGGVDAELEAFKKKYEEVSNIILVPFQHRSRIPLYLKAADVLVIPNSGKTAISSKYTSPLKLFEYMAARRPIAVSDLPSMRQVLNDGNCFFAEADNPFSLANAIMLAFGDELKAKEKADRAFADVKKFTWQERARQIVSFISL